MNKNKESLKRVNQNQFWLTVLERQAQKYREFLESLRFKKEKNFQFNPDFIKKQEKEKEKIQEASSEDKPSFISGKIEELKNINSKLKNKVSDFQESKISKDELFKHLEQEIEQFSSMIEQLKAENRQLKQVLELLLEKSQKESQKSNLEKENTTLKEKIENMKNKEKTPFDEDYKEKKPEKLNNKVTYTNEQEER